MKPILALFLLLASTSIFASHGSFQNNTNQTANDEFHQIAAPSSNYFFEIFNKLDDTNKETELDKIDLKNYQLKFFGPQNSYFIIFCKNGKTVSFSFKSNETNQLKNSPETFFYINQKTGLKFIFQGTTILGIRKFKSDEIKL